MSSNVNSVGSTTISSQTALSVKSVVMIDLKSNASPFRAQPLNSYPSFVGAAGSSIVLPLSISEVHGFSPLSGSNVTVTYSITTPLNFS